MRFAFVVVLASCSSPRESADQPPPAPAPPSPTVADAAGSIPDAVSADAAVPDAAVPRAAIVEAPIRWSTRREELTLAYRRRHSEREATDLTIEPRVVVLHYTGGGSAKGTRSYMDNVEIERERPALRAAGLVNVSSHFVVDRDGTIYRLQPETRFARHCIGLNHLAIGIENVGDLDRWPLTEAQVEANAALIRELVARFPITHVLGHFEVMGFRDHAYYRELDPSYKNSKPDPGPAYMAKVRARIADLKLAGP